MSTALSYYFNEEHESFRKTIRQFLEAEAIPNIDQWELDGKIPREFWKKFGEMGYFGLCYPEQYGGSNLDFFYNVVMLEEISKIFSGGFAITAAVQVFMSTPYIMHHGSEYLKENYLKPAIEGSKIGCIGITEPGAGSDAANIQMRARKEGDYYILNGSKTFITNGIYGHFVILVCKTNPEAGAAGVSLLVVDLNSEGIAKNKLKKLGWYSSDTAELHFDNVKVPAKNLLGEEGKGFYYLMGGLQLERLAGSIMGYAGCEAILQYGLEYMSQRSAFGRTINKFQVLRHRVAQMSAEIESVKFFILHICRMNAEGKYAVKESSMAKLLATELADKCTYQVLQFLGGYGYMEEYKAARAFRDARIGTIGGGSSEIMREIIAKMVIDDVNYERASSAGNNGEKPSLNTVADIFATLPSRFKAEKAAGKNLNIHFQFTNDAFTVSIADGKLEVEKGLHGDANCLVETDDKTYINVETGKINPQEAFMTGKIKVSDLMQMMAFGGLFKKL
ncbi:MAG: acyl-CoA dehydrogenase family protein [Sphingobacteriales bacterium]|nr:acyl-CoA dehydrogenase family protein [Sphingobacteriales bacterium]